MRALGKRMFDDFKAQDGCLHGLLEMVLQDGTLELEMRGKGAAAIYYRGGRLFRIEQDGSTYALTFDTNYCFAGNELAGNLSITDAVQNAPIYKQSMDRWLAKHGKYESEFRQIVVRDNNGHGETSHATDYYIADIEYAYAGKRLDMVAVHWPSTGAMRKNRKAPKLALIEMKYGDGSLGGESGIMEHLQDFMNFRQTADISTICADYAEVFRQKCDLGLIPDLADLPHDIVIQSEDVDLIFLLANHDPAKSKLTTIVNALDSAQYPFVKFAFASMMGYGLYDEMMYSIEEFQTYLASVPLRKK